MMATLIPYVDIWISHCYCRCTIIAKLGGNMTHLHGVIYLIGTWTGMSSTDVYDRCLSFTLRYQSRFTQPIGSTLYGSKVPSRLDMHTLSERQCENKKIHLGSATK